MQILNPNLFNTFFLFYVHKYNSAPRNLGSFEFFATICCERHQADVKHADV